MTQEGTRRADTGTDPERRATDRTDAHRLLAGGGEMGKVIAQKDWARTPLGPIESWSPELRTTVSLALASTFPISIAWGPGHVQIYNDGYWPLCGAKHPTAMGQDFRECWASAFPVIGAAYERAWAGEASYLENQRMFVDRNGYLEETFFTFSFSPIRDESGQVAGLFHPVTETTSQMLSERRIRSLRDVAARAGKAKTVEQACRLAAQTLADYELDLPFVLLYRTTTDGSALDLAGAAGLEAGAAAAPDRIVLGAGVAEGWPLAAALASDRETIVSDLPGRFGSLRCGPYPEPPASAFVMPLRIAGVEQPFGVLIAGVSPRLALDETYRDYFGLLSSAVSVVVGNARAYEEESKRAEALAEIDRAKTAFFSNVSHEFRTPLTLILGPLEDALQGSARSLSGADLEVTHRNALRLQKLVNALLEFSRIEAGRVKARYEPVDLAGLTSDLASVFRSAIERAGLELRLRCEPLGGPVHVDRDMWEKIILNLLSNAFKFTFSGVIEVGLRRTGDHAELTVRDTGTGIPPHELPRLFERFHRIEGASARSHEGSGIGLALVQELVRLHAGEIRATSELGVGTTFRVTIPLGTAHLPKDRFVAARPQGPPTQTAAHFLQEALQWLPGTIAAPLDLPLPAPEARERACERILVVDDNSDLRDYLRRVLGTRWVVETVADGESALRSVRCSPPDLVLTDVMMPGLDGFGLLAELRRDPRTRSMPVVMLSARAGEEARVEGLDAGADDYLIKPFGARELIARVASQLALSAGRRERALLYEREQLACKEAEAATRAKDEFLAMLGHELRNPLSPMLTALQLMRLHGSQTREQDILERQVGHLARLVDDLLDASRIARGTIELRRQTCEIADVVVRALEIASPVLEQRRHHVDVRVARRGLAANVDPARMAQVFLNLFTNAAKYSEPGSRIQIEGERVNGRVLIRVRDEGIGIKPEMLGKVFDRFVQEKQTLDRSRGGLGLGLTIVRSLVELHGGVASAWSEGLGRGSTFSIDLPAVDSAPLEVGEMASTAVRGQRAASGRKRILVVDDNEDVVETLRAALEMLGYQVEVAHDGPSALKAAEAFRPEIALLDIGLPVMDGYELARRLRELRTLPEDLHLVAVTGYGQDSDRRRSAAAGFERHLVKPVDLDKLERVVEELRP